MTISRCVGTAARIWRCAVATATSCSCCSSRSALVRTFSNPTICNTGTKPTTPRHYGIHLLFYNSVVWSFIGRGFFLVYSAGCRPCHGFYPTVRTSEYNFNGSSSTGANGKSPILIQFFLRRSRRCREQLTWLIKFFF